MERTNINIFKNFAVISVILPYFSYTHRIFLLLSSLCVGSRNKLDEFYDEFRNVMRKYCMKLDTIKNPNILKFPCDLFKFTISVKSQTDLNNFIEFVINISERKFNYFHKHFIHEKIFVFSTTIDFEFVEQLYPYIEIIKSIEVCFSNKYRFGNHEEDVICTLHDTIYLNCDPYKIHKNGFDFRLFFTNDNCELINPFFESFKKIDFVNMRAYTSDTNKIHMELIEKASLKPKLFITEGLQQQDLENFANPKFLKQGIDLLYYEPGDSFDKFSDNFIENLKILNPKEIIYSDIEISEEKLKVVNYNITKILTSQDGVSISVDMNPSKNVELLLKNTTIKFIQSNNDYFYVNCKYFRCFINFDKFNDQYWFSISKNNKSTESQYLNFNFTGNFLIYESHIINGKEELKRMDELFPKTDIKKHCYFIVPMLNLEKVTFLSTFIDSYEQSKEKEENLMKLLVSNRIFCNIHFSSSKEKIKDIFSIFPSRTEYIISYYGVKRDKTLYLGYYDLLNKLCWENIRITSIVFTQELTDEEYLLICHILSTSKVKGWLKNINLIVKNLSEALNIAKLCFTCINLESITLKYDFVDEEKELIEKYLKMFTMNADRVCSIKILQKKK